MDRQGHHDEQIGVDELDWYELRRRAEPATRDIVARLGQEMATVVDKQVQPGSRVGVAVGSRGIARLGEVVAALIAALHNRGAIPVVIPAMGSHGGATSTGQIGVLGELGIDAEALGAFVDA